MTLPFNVIAIVIFVRYFLSGSFSDFCRQKVEHKSANKTAQSSEFPNFWITSLNDLEFSSGLWSSLQKGCPTRERGSKVKKKEDGKAIESLPYVSDQSTCTPEDKKWGHCLRSLWSKPFWWFFFSTLMYGVIMYNLITMIFIYIYREREKFWMKIKIYNMFHLRFIFATPPGPSRTTSAKVLWPSLSDASQLWPSQKTVPRPNPGTMWGFNVDVFWFYPLDFFFKDCLDVHRERDRMERCIWHTYLCY